METIAAHRKPTGQLKESKRRRTWGPVGTICNHDISSTVSKASRDACALENGSTSEHEFDDSVLPPIANHVTMAHIIPNLCWTDTLKLASVSRAWFHSIKSHLLYNERAFYRVPQTFIALPYCRPRSSVEVLKGLRTTSIAIYSMKDDRCYELPALPYFHVPFPGNYQCKSVAVDNKVYVMEFYASFQRWTPRSVTRRVMAFDVAGQGGWQQCANMKGAQGNIQCGIVNGKIYAVGGFDRIFSAHNSSTVTSEVFNPKENTWSLIKPVKYPDLSDPVWVLGDKLVVRPTVYEEEDEDLNDLPHENLNLYDPTEDEWTEVKLSLDTDRGWSFHKKFREKVFEMFIAKGKFYIMDTHDIYIYDSDSRMWKHLHTCSYTGIGMGPTNSFVIYPKMVLVVDEELVAIVEVQQIGDLEDFLSEDNNRYGERKLVLRSTSRLGGDNSEIVWQRTSTDALDWIEGGIAGVLRI